MIPVECLYRVSWVLQGKYRTMSHSRFSCKLIAYESFSNQHIQGFHPWYNIAFVLIFELCGTSEVPHHQSTTRQGKRANGRRGFPKKGSPAFMIFPTEIFILFSV